MEEKTTNRKDSILEVAQKIGEILKQPILINIAFNPKTNKMKIHSLTTKASLQDDGEDEVVCQIFSGLEDERKMKNDLRDTKNYFG